MSGGSIYQVGVHLMARDGVSGILANIGKHALGLHGTVEHLSKGISKMQVGLLGAGAVAAGLALGHVTEKFVEHGFELQHWKSQMMAAGATSEQVALGVNRAWEVAGSNINTTATENLKNIIELNKATGDWAESAKLLPTFAKAETVLRSVKAEGLRDRMVGNSTQTLNFARGLEELGVTQMGKTAEDREASIQRYAGEFVKTMISSRGLFDGNALYAMTNNAGGAGQNWDLRMATTVAPILGEIMKAGKMGNADYMAVRTFQGGTIQGKAVEALVNNHLAKLGAQDDASADAYKDDKGFHLKANSHFAEGMEKNLWDWSTRTLEKMKANGVDIDNQHAVNKIVNEIGSNKSTTMLMRAILEPLTRLQIQKDMTARDRVTDDAAGIQQANDPFLKLNALKAKWDDFLVALGTPLVPRAMAGLDAITNAVNKTSHFLNAHPNLAGAIAGTMAVAAGVLVLGGSLAIGGAVAAALGTGGWLVVGVTAFGAALAAVGITSSTVKDHFARMADDFSNGLQRMRNSYKSGSWSEWFSGLWSMINASLNNVPNTVGDAARRMADAVGQKIADAILAIPGMIGGALGKLSGMIKGLLPGGSSGSPLHPGAAMGDDLLQPQSYHVPSTNRSKQPVVIHASIQMDRKTLGRASMTAMLDNFGGPSRGSAMPDDSRANYGTGSAYSPGFA